VVAAEQSEKRAAQLDPPRRRRGRVLVVGLALAAIGAVAAKAHRAKAQASQPPTTPGY
jgi:hypothetical protein